MSSFISSFSPYLGTSLVAAASTSLAGLYFQGRRPLLSDALFATAIVANSVACAIISEKLWVGISIAALSATLYLFRNSFNKDSITKLSQASNLSLIVNAIAFSFSCMVFLQKTVDNAGIKL